MTSTVNATILLFYILGAFNEQQQHTTIDKFHLAQNRSNWYRWVFYLNKEYYASECNRKVEYVGIASRWPDFDKKTKMEPSRRT